MEKKVFNAEKFVAEELGGAFVGANDDGSINVKTIADDGSEQVRKFNLQKMLQDDGVDVSKVEFKYNSPESALDENAVGFSTAMKLNYARTAQDKIKVLEEQFGPGKVQQVGDEFKVNEGGVWKKADTNFFTDLTANSPTMAAGIAGSIGGAKAGAAIGTAVLPIAGTAVGAVVGSIVGGAFAAAVTKVGVDKAAEAYGIRTDDDADSALQEIGKEFVHNAIWDTALMGAGKVLKPTAKWAGRAAGRVAGDVVDKVALAETAEKVLMPGTKKFDWLTVLRSADDAKAVKEGIEEIVDWESKRAAVRSSSGAVSAIDPVTKKMNNWVRRSMVGFKNKAMRSYGAAIDALEQNGQLAKARVGIDDTLVKLESTLDDMGLLKKGADGTTEFLKKSQAADADKIMTLFDAKSRNTLQTVWQTLSNAAKRPDKLTFKEAKQLLDGVDDVLESSGYYKGGEMAISNQARRALKGIRHQIRNKVSESLTENYVLQNGKRVSARVIFDDASLKYSQFRSAYDDFAMSSRFGGDDQQVAATIQRMFGESGGALEDTFGKLASAAGDDGAKILNRLQQLRAAKNLSNQYGNRTGIAAWTASKLGYGNPRAMVSLVNESPRLTATKAPPSPKKLALMQAMSQTNEFFKRLPGPDRRQILSSPELYRQMIETMLSAPELAGQTEQELLSPLAAPGGQ